MKAKISKILISICLIFTFCFFFTGCGDNDYNQGVLQLNTKYYEEGRTLTVSYYIFTSNTKGYSYTRQKNDTTEYIDNFVWEYVANDAISCTFSIDDTHFNVLIASVGKNVIFFENGSTYIAENYLIKNNIPYLK